MDTFSNIIAAVLIATGAVVLVCLFISLPVMWLWNAVVPDVFGLRELTWTQALWLSLLCGFLFKSNSSSKSN